MLFDAFISHASEDKEDFVAPLAKLLRDHRVEVWFDEFTLTVGKSLRQSIDAGLAKSRFAIVVLSPSFFGKRWPEWELNGIVQRQLAGTGEIILPIWHKVNHSDVAHYSPPLADIVALSSNSGIEAVAAGLLKAIRPEGSALVVARDILIDFGCQPPVITDDWWLDVIEGSGSQDDRRWNFPTWKMTNASSSRGEELAWTVMQHLWQEEAEEARVSQMTHPTEMIEFIENQAGLLELALAVPEVLIEHAPQLSIKGFGGPLEDAIEVAYQRSVSEYKARRARKDRSGSALTTNGLCPACHERFALRHPTFGDYEPGMVTCGFVQGQSLVGRGPDVRAYETIDYLVWLLSRNSSWLPPGHRGYLLQGMKEWPVWQWGRQNVDSDYSGGHAGALADLMFSAASPQQIRSFELSGEALADIRDRVDYSRALLGLSDSTDELASAFIKERIAESWLAAQDRRRRDQQGA